MSNIDRSSWVSWACYYLGFVLAWGNDLARDVAGFHRGTALLLGSIALFFVCVVAIQRYMHISLTSNTFGEPQRLVTSGVFRWSRNPIYLAFLLPLASLAYYSPLACLVATVAYLVSMTYYVIAREERVLGGLFGEDFNAYRASTPRWLLV